MIVKTENRRDMLRHVASWGENAPSTGVRGTGRGVAIAVASLYVGLAGVVSAIALGGFVLATGNSKRYDQAKNLLDRHATYAVAAYVAE